MACGRGMVPGVGIPGLGVGFGVPDFVGSVKVGVAALAGVAVPPGFGMPGFAAVPAPGFGAPGFTAPGFAVAPGFGALGLTAPGFGIPGFAVAPGFGAPGFAAGPGLTALLAPPAPGFGAPGLAAGVDCVDFAAGAS